VSVVNVVEQTSINAIVAVGMTFVIVSGGIDLSVRIDRRWRASSSAPRSG
jgi:ribose/xylose/arabinose/galactoside ABC-type transport system permease subunit